MLAKAKRGLARFGAAEEARNSNAMSDALFDLAVVLPSLKDWLKKHRSAAFSETTVEQYLNASTALSSFRNIANSGKHRAITKYVPRTRDVFTFAPSSSLAFIENPASDNKQPNPYPVSKSFAQTARHRAMDLARTAIHDWQTFMQQ